MKKLLFILLLSVFSLGYSQEFTKYYTHFATKYSTQESFTILERNSVIKFNHGNTYDIFISTSTNTMRLTMISKITREETTGGDTYQRVDVITERGEKGTMILFDSNKLGCLLMFGNISIGFSNLYIK